MWRKILFWLVYTIAMLLAISARFIDLFQELLDEILLSLEKLLKKLNYRTVDEDDDNCGV